MPSKRGRRKKELNQSTSRLTSGRHGTLHCLVDKCKLKRQSSKDMIQCGYCAVWHHLECVGLKCTDPVGVWPCPQCRHLSDMLRQCHTMLQQVSSLVAALELLHDQLHKDIALIQKSKSLEKTNLDLVKLLAVKTADCDGLVKQNRDLITGKKSEPQRGSARPDQQATDQRALVLGSSIIAGLDPKI